MTCAGITSLVIALDRVQPPDARVVGDRIECCVPRKTGDADDVDRIERGIQWLGPALLRQPPIPAPARSLLYYLYGLERAGRLTARRFLPLPSRPGQADRADWYREGADYLVRQQDIAVGLLDGATAPAKPSR